MTVACSPRGRVEDLLGEKVSRTRVRSGRPARRQALPGERRGTPSRAEPDHLVVEGHEHPEQITRLLAEKGIYVQELTEIRPTLESFFLKLTGPTGTPAGGTASKEKDQ